MSDSDEDKHLLELASLCLAHAVDVSFSSTPARNLRLWWPYATNDSELLLKLNMQTLPFRRFVWSPTRGRLPPGQWLYLFDTARGHGSYYWGLAPDSNVYTLNVKLVGGGETLEIRTENAVVVNQNLAVSIDDFYDIKETFLSNLAGLLGIDKSSIIIATIVPGSVNLKFIVSVTDPSLEAPTQERNYDTAGNVDAETSSVIDNDVSK